MKRIQRKRTKGWRMPPNTVYVGRGSQWGNPYKFTGEEWDAPEEVLEMYRNHIIGRFANSEVDFEELRGRDLACWCPLDSPCHADVLLTLLRDVDCRQCGGVDEHRSSCSYRKAQE